MKNIVILASAYYPNPSPTDYFTKLIAEHLALDNRVTVISIKKNPFDSTRAIQNGVKIINIDNVLAGKIKNAKMPVVKHYFVMIQSIRSLLVFPNGQQWYVKSCLKILNRINEKRHIDIIISICSPFAAHLAGLNWKKKSPNCKWITYTLDPYYISSVKYRGKLVKLFRNKKALKWEKSVYKTADINLLADGMVEQAEYRYLESLSSSVHIHFPLPVIPEQHAGRSKNKSISCLYCGGFYYDIRNPRFMFEVFSGIQDLYLTVYTNGSCGDIVDSYRTYPNIAIREYLPKEEILREQGRADILVNIENSISGMRPSKTCEYVASGKPMVYFYRNNNIDPMIAKYPMVLLIDEDNTSINEARDKIRDFCLAYLGKRLSNEKISEIYSMHSISCFYSVIDRAINHEHM